MLITKVLSSQASSLLVSIIDEEFIFNLNVLKVVLTPTTRLSDYLQGRNLDIRKAHENVQMVIQTLENLRNDESFEEVRSKSNHQVAEVIEFIEKEDLSCSMKKVRVPRASRQWEGDVEAYLRVNNYFQSIDKITAELHGRFDDESKSILNSLATICFDEDVEKNVFLLSLNKCFHQLPFYFLHCHLTGQKLIKTGSREENTVKNSTSNVSAYIVITGSPVKFFFSRYK